MHQHVKSNPVKYIDPFGMEDQEPVQPPPGTVGPDWIPGYIDPIPGDTREQVRDCLSECIHPSNNPEKPPKLHPANPDPYYISNVGVIVEPSDDGGHEVSGEMVLCIHLNEDDPPPIRVEMYGVVEYWENDSDWQSWYQGGYGDPPDQLYAQENFALTLLPEEDYAYYIRIPGIHVIDTEDHSGWGENEYYMGATDMIVIITYEDHTEWIFPGNLQSGDRQAPPPPQEQVPMAPTIVPGPVGPVLIPGDGDASETRPGGATA